MSDYRQTLDFLFALQRVGIKLGLHNIIALLKELGDPHTRWPSIHLAGTNGKGSTAAMLEAILEKAGYRVGLYTSPHLVDFRERIRVERRPIDQPTVVEFVARLRLLIEKLQPSFFEVTTALAFWYFAREKVEVAVVETGMGGRLDSTNVLHPLITVITPIGFDHQNYLGKTLSAIAGEKAGIIKEGTPCISNNRRRRVLEVLRQTCAGRGAEFIDIFAQGSYRLRRAEIDHTLFDLHYGQMHLEECRVNLPGEHQLENALLAVGTLLRLRDSLPVGQTAIRAGLPAAQWKGRLHRLSRRPDIIIDVSHNPPGFRKTFAFIHNFFPPERIEAITFLQKDKDFRKIGDILSSSVNKTWIVDLQAGKPLSPEKLLRVIQAKKKPVEIVDSLQSLRELMNSAAGKDKLWLIIGSHYLAGEAYQFFSQEIRQESENL